MQCGPEKSLSSMRPVSKRSKTIENVTESCGDGKGRRMTYNHLTPSLATGRREGSKGLRRQQRNEQSKTLIRSAKVVTRAS